MQDPVIRSERVALQTRARDAAYVAALGALDLAIKRVLPNVQTTILANNIRVTLSSEENMDVELRKIRSLPEASCVYVAAYPYAFVLPRNDAKTLRRLFNGIALLALLFAVYFVWEYILK